MDLLLTHGYLLSADDPRTPLAPLIFVCSSLVGRFRGSARAEKPGKLDRIRAAFGAVAGRVGMLLTGHEQEA